MQGICPTPRDVVFEDGSARLYRFYTPGDEAAPGERPVALLVPSLINRWYVLDLREGASLVQACLDAGLDTYCLDWGEPRDEDRYLSWEDVLRRLSRMRRRVHRMTGAETVGLLGYCMGGTLCAIHTALEPEGIGGLINLAGPIDFGHAGTLGVMTDPRWFDVHAIADVGNVSPEQMQSGFVAMRPTGQVSKWITLADRVFKPGFLDSFRALDTWANDNVPFPAEAYRTYIEDLYQKNLLVKGEHRALGQAVDLGSIEVPLLTIAASSDHICPEAAARGFHDAAGSEDKELVVVRGGHVGAVVGSRASRELYPQITSFFAKVATPRKVEAAVVKEAAPAGGGAAEAVVEEAVVEEKTPAKKSSRKSTKSSRSTKKTEKK